MVRFEKAFFGIRSRTVDSNLCPLLAYGFLVHFFLTTNARWTSHDYWHTLHWVGVGFVYPKGFEFDSTDIP
jgi:hypothetical protein